MSDSLTPEQLEAFKEALTQKFGPPREKKSFVVEHTPYEFNGSIRTMVDDVQAFDCEDAVIRFRNGNPKFPNILGVKPKNALRWRRDKSLLERGADAS